mgnify:FL=1
MIERLEPDNGAALSDRRGQLLLVGAVALAIIILGLSIVVNTVLFTENVGTGEARVEAPAIEEFSFEAQKSARSLMLRVNGADRTDAIADVNASIGAQLANYSDAVARSYAASGTVFVDVSYNETLRNGTRIVQGSDRKFTYPASHDSDLSSNRSDWSPVADPTEVGWMVFNVDLRNTSGQQTTVELTNDTGATLTYRFNRSNGGNGADLRVEATNSATGGTESASCESTGGRVLLDMRRGEAFLSECTFPGIGWIEPPYSVNITKGHRLAGQYDIIVNESWHTAESSTIDAEDGGTDRPYPHCPDGVEEPCLSPVVWQGQVDLTYRSADVNFATVRNITVYDP